MNYDEMSAGPDLDRLVAERVWSLRSESTLSINGRFSWAKDDGWWIAARDDSGWERFQPSTNIAHAWEVVEKMRERDKHLMVGVWPNGRWAAAEMEDGDWDGCASFSVGDTAPLAICRAALKAVK